MKRPFVVGERVRVYSWTSVPEKATVVRVLEDGILGLKCDGGEGISYSNPKCVRRLRLVKRRRVWIRCGKDGGISATNNKLDNPVVFDCSKKEIESGEYYEFIEVRK